MAETRRKFDRDFREGAVRIVVRETGKPIAQVARDLGINEGTLGNWIARNRQARAGGNGALTEDQRVQLLQLDRYLGKTGFSSQQTKQKQPPDAPVNLWEPADGPDSQAKNTAP